VDRVIYPLQFWYCLSNRKTDKIATPSKGVAILCQLPTGYHLLTVAEWTGACARNSCEPFSSPSRWHRNQVTQAAAKGAPVGPRRLSAHRPCTRQENLTRTQPRRELNEVASSHRMGAPSGARQDWTCPLGGMTSASARERCSRVPVHQREPMDGSIPWGYHRSHHKRENNGIVMLCLRSTLVGFHLRTVFYRRAIRYT